MINAPTRFALTAILSGAALSSSFAGTRILVEDDDSVRGIKFDVSKVESDFLTNTVSASGESTGQPTLYTETHYTCSTVVLTWPQLGGKFDKKMRSALTQKMNYHLHNKCRDLTIICRPASNSEYKETQDGSQVCTISKIIMDNYPLAMARGDAADISDSSCGSSEEDEFTVTEFAEEFVRGYSASSSEHFADVSTTTLPERAPRYAEPSISTTSMSETAPRYAEPSISTTSMPELSPHDADTSTTATSATEPVEPKAPTPQLYRVLQQLRKA